MNVLFVCSRNRWRSPTAAHTFGRDPRWNVRSAGTSSSAVRVVNAADLAWADVIVVMEREHRSRLRERFPESRSMDVVVLDIPDEYEYLDPELVRLLEALVEPMLERLADGMASPFGS